MEVIDSIFSVPDVVKLHKGVPVLEGYLLQPSVPTFGIVDKDYALYIVLVPCNYLCRQFQILREVYQK